MIYRLSLCRGIGASMCYLVESRRYRVLQKMNDLCAIDVLVGDCVTVKLRLSCGLGLVIGIFLFGVLRRCCWNSM